MTGAGFATGIRFTAPPKLPSMLTILGPLSGSMKTSSTTPQTVTSTDLTPSYFVHRENSRALSSTSVMCDMAATVGDHFGNPSQPFKSSSTTAKGRSNGRGR
eukprot:CAMPEP_0176092662 /NCGR_PEP_ID=MMETSP0120_2-20121206/46424_1 /TAXON_ID=160619 /ORGANISM="Kryptoperidinium foliaceum, Strain CCMP 1326" /LENGTH=101 /DNA_ID=CAMNT_0017426581 /DNA_START=220 /DNA_END=522 /DNA_ORIENTATION=-